MLLISPGMFILQGGKTTSNLGLGGIAEIPFAAGISLAIYYTVYKLVTR